MLLKPGFDHNSFLVLGIGNLVMGDDGIGVRIVQQLSLNYHFPDNVKIVDGGTLGLDLLPLLEGVSHLIIVDAVDIGGVAGSYIKLFGDEVPIALETKLSPHQMGVKDILAVSRLIGHLPEHIVLFGVQPGSIEMNVTLTPEVETVIDSVIFEILEQLFAYGVTFNRKSEQG